MSPPAPEPPPATTTARLVGLLPLAPVLALGALLAASAVDVPYKDEWYVPGNQLLAYARGRLTLADMLSQFVEHRHLATRLVYFAVALTAGWDARIIHWIVFGLACAAAAGLARVVRTTVPGGPRAHAAVMTLVTLLVFSPIQSNGWLWGLHLAVSAPMACLCVALALARSPRWTRLHLAACSLLAAAGSFSFAHGLASWGFLLPVLVVRATQARAGEATAARPPGAGDPPAGERAGPGPAESTAWWLAAAAATFLLYFHDYHRPPGPRVWFEAALASPVVAGRLFLAALGGPLAADRFGVATAVGAVALATLAACALRFAAIPRGADGAGRWAVLVRTGGLADRMLPWLTLAAAAAASGGLVALGRTAFGAERALLPRYQNLTLYLHVALVALVPIVLAVLPDGAAGRSALPGGRRARRAVLAAAAAAMLALQVPSWVHGARAMADVRRERLHAKACLLLVRAVDQPCRDLSRATPIEAIRRKVDVLAPLDLFRPVPLEGPELPPGVQADGPPDRERARFDRLQVDGDGRLLARGRATLPGGAGPAHAVLLTRPGANGAPRAVALAQVGRRGRPGRVPAGGRDRWRVELDAADLGPPPVTLTAWAVDAPTGRFHPGQSLVVPRPAPSRSLPGRP